MRNRRGGAQGVKVVDVQHDWFLLWLAVWPWEGPGHELGEGISPRVKDGNAMPSGIWAAAGGQGGSVRSNVLSAAELTVAAAQRAVTYASGGFAIAGCFSADAVTVLELVAATEPAVITARRLSTTHLEGGDGELPESMGLPAHAATAWAQLTDASSIHARAVAALPTPRSEVAVERSALGGRLSEPDRRIVVARALEAIALWNTEPLPVVDIVSAARAAAGR